MWLSELLEIKNYQLVCILTLQKLNRYCSTYYLMRRSSRRRDSSNLRLSRIQKTMKRRCKRKISLRISTCFCFATRTLQCNWRIRTNLFGSWLSIQVSGFLRKESRASLIYLNTVLMYHWLSHSKIDHVFSPKIMNFIAAGLGLTIS